MTFAGNENLLDPDAVAKRINPGDSAAAGVRAAREVLSRTRDYLDRGESFAIETTLSGRNTLETMREAKRRGYWVRLIYICLDDPSRNVRRVAERVARGGHWVPERDVFRRYERSVSHFRAALKIADECVAFDNSGQAPRKVLEIRGGAVMWRSPELPGWVVKALEL
jgi:predicted ABC-type ATPase